jgi:chromosomal replication initiator protein
MTSDRTEPADQPRAEIAQAWGSICAQLRAEYGVRTFDSWLRPVAPLGFDGDVMVLRVPNGFMRDWIKSHFQERLRTLWAAHLPQVRGVRLDIGEPRLGGAMPLPSELDGHAPMLPDDEFEGSPLDPRFTFERFVVGQPNQFAFSAARRVAEGAPVTYNPLFLHSSVGLGKTHLMHAIGWELRRLHPTKRVLYISAEKFMVEFVAALRHQDTASFKQRFRSVDVLMIDDVQFIAGKNSTQDEFFHTMNALIDARKQLVISADRSPSSLEGIEERIRSRLGWGLVADIHATDYELRLGILQAKRESHADVAVPEEVIEFLARRITSNVRELEGALNRVAAHSGLTGRPMTLEFTKDVLQDLIRANDRKITIDEIQRKVAEHYKLRLSDLLSARRSVDVARPRQVAMYLAKQFTPRSLPEIGRKFGGRDHTTVMHAVKRIEELRLVNSELDRDLTLLTRLLDG